MKTHYHVLTGMHGGYLPDDNWYCTTLKEARNVAAEWARTYRDDFTEYEDGVWGPSWTVKGSCKAGYYDVQPLPYSETALGFYIEITECVEEGCEDEEYE